MKTSIKILSGHLDKLKIKYERYRHLQKVDHVGIADRVSARQKANSCKVMIADIEKAINCLRKSK